MQFCFIALVGVITVLLGVIFSPLWMPIPLLFWLAVQAALSRSDGSKKD